MFQLLQPLVYAIQPYLVPICFCLTWGLILLFGLTIWSTVTHSVTIAKRMHQIPCSHCQFFTADYRLKCTVHPSVANTESAINCSDYCPNNSRVSTTW
ncbi:hypothetical protein NDI39_21670 [Microcoleus sp. ZQ-A2]|nr:hypothetical protein [Microcoleus sp. FACHB-1]